MLRDIFGPCFLLSVEFAVVFQKIPNSLLSQMFAEIGNAGSRHQRSTDSDSPSPTVLMTISPRNPPPDFSADATRKQTTHDGGGATATRQRFEELT